MTDTRRTLDWRPNPDVRSHKFAFSLLDCYRSALLPRKSVNWYRTAYLDQGVEGACTGFGAAHVLEATPRPRRPMTNEEARDIYHLARRHDEWEGEDYEGSSINGAMKACRELGHITSWRWLYSMGEVDHALSWHGPFEAGTWWYTGMFNTDSDGFIKPWGQQEGGHAYKIAGCGMLNGAKWYQIDNSWGKDWGRDGSARIWADDLNRLLNEDGEFAIPAKVKP